MRIRISPSLRDDASMSNVGRVTWTLIALLTALYGYGRTMAQESRGATVARGGQLARTVCSACHVVTRDGDFPPVLQPPAPSFLDIANRPGTTAKTLRHFILRTHWDMKTSPERMPNPMMRPEDAAALAAYILSLKERSTSP